VFTTQQEDALVDLFKNRCGQVAPSLSALTGHSVVLAMPGLNLQPLDQVANVLNDLQGADVLAVHQILAGSVASDALLVLNLGTALVLTNLLSADRPSLPKLDASDREALTEVANNLINACLGALSDFLHDPIAAAVPHLRMDSFSGLLHSLAIREDELHDALILTVDFLLRESTLRSYLIVMLHSVTTTRLQEAVEAAG
jgi:chemotaxis protein CheY-P-specific phosphatase CheC